MLELCSGFDYAPLRLRSGSAQALLRMLRFGSGSGQERSPSAQVKAAVAHVRRLKRNQRQGKLILSLWAFLVCFPWHNICGVTKGPFYLKYFFIAVS